MQNIFFCLNTVGHPQGVCCGIPPLEDGGGRGTTIGRVCVGFFQPPPPPPAPSLMRVLCAPPGVGGPRVDPHAHVRTHGRTCYYSAQTAQNCGILHRAPPPPSVPVSVSVSGRTSVDFGGRFGCGRGFCPILHVDPPSRSFPAAPLEARRRQSDHNSEVRCCPAPRGHLN